jgi:hypothetical protein
MPVKGGAAVARIRWETWASLDIRSLPLRETDQLLVAPIYQARAKWCAHASQRLRGFTCRMLGNVMQP